eukprot:s140_g67.t2
MFVPSICHLFKPRFPRNTPKKLRPSMLLSNADVAWLNWEPEILAASRRARPKNLARSLARYRPTQQIPSKHVPWLEQQVEAGGMVRYLSPKNEKSVDRCEFPDGNYQHFRVWYVDSTGHNQLAGPKPYTVKNDPGVDLYVWTVQDNSGWFEYDFEVSWRAYARAKMQASAHAEPDREKRQKQVRAGTC